MAAAALGLFAAYTRAGEGPHHSYVVVNHSMAPGARLASGDLALEPMELPSVLRSRTFDDRSVLAGATVISPLEAGELVQASAVVATGSSVASRELTFSVERGHMTSGLKQGERVDILATYGTGSDALTSIVVRQAVVVSLEKPRSSLGEGSGVAVTIGLDKPDDVLAMAHASQLAKVTLVRSTGAPPLPETSGYRPTPAVTGAP